MHPKPAALAANGPPMRDSGVKVEPPTVSIIGLVVVDVFFVVEVRGLLGHRRWRHRGSSTRAPVPIPPLLLLTLVLILILMTIVISRLHTRNADMLTPTPILLLLLALPMLIQTLY